MILSKRDWAKIIWATGIGAALIGELWAANDADKGNTISEYFEALPFPARFAIAFALGAVCSHFARWIVSDPTTTVNVEVNDHATD